MLLDLIIGTPLAIATAIAGYGWVLRHSLPATKRPSWGWTAALAVLLIADAVLVLGFFFAILVYNCHARYECPF
jgi:hypothetical protein